MIFSTMNILNSRLGRIENETANKLSEVDILEAINNRMETIEKALSNLQNEVVAVTTTLSEHTETLRREEEHHSSIEQRLNVIDDERNHIERENEHLYEDLLRIKSHSMKYNLIFEGIPQETGENTEAVMKKSGKEKPEIDDDIAFQNVHWLGPNRDKPRGIHL
jgi:chromosome segregation ATPase